MRERADPAAANAGPQESGKEYTTPLMFGRDGDNLVLIASKGGDPRNPAWYHNLQAGGGGGSDRPRAASGAGARRRRAKSASASGTQMVGLYPAYAGYQKKTTRQIPVVVLEPI